MEPTASQSADCEPTPPLQRHGSKSNFFLPPVENNESPRHPPPSQHRHPIHYPRGSPHPRPRYLTTAILKRLILMFIIFIEGWTDLEVTHLTRYHRRRVVHLPQSLSVRVASARRCNNVSKLLEYLLRLPYPVPYEGTLTCALSKEKSLYSYIVYSPIYIWRNIF